MEKLTPAAHSHPPWQGRQAVCARPQSDRLGRGGPPGLVGYWLDMAHGPQAGDLSSVTLHLTPHRGFSCSVANGHLAPLEHTSQEGPRAH